MEEITITVPVRDNKTGVTFDLEVNLPATTRAPEITARREAWRIMENFLCSHFVVDYYCEMLTIRCLIKHKIINVEEYYTVL